VAPPRSSKRIKFRVGSRAGIAAARVRSAIAELTSVELTGAELTDEHLSDKTNSFCRKSRFGSSRIASADSAFEHRANPKNMPDQMKRACGSRIAAKAWEQNIKSIAKTSRDATALKHWRFSEKRCVNSM
jgi:hypothetical protein